jgi:transketolase
MSKLGELAAKDPRIILLVGDLGYSVVESFRDRYPSQFLNVGVAEQDMVGVAAGLALSDRVAFTYSIANFATFRCLEQIRNDVCYHGANVKLVSVGGGFSYGALGASHHGTEDIAIMRAIPRMVVVAPNDPVEASLATVAIAEYDGPCYLRLGRGGEPTVHSQPPKFSLGAAIPVRAGDDVTMLVTGGLLPNALEAADRLQKRGISAEVISVHTVNPLDMSMVTRAASHTGALVTIEEHSIVGGLGSAVAEVLLENAPFSMRFLRIGVRADFSTRVGDQAYLRRQHGLDPLGIAAAVGRLLHSPIEVAAVR